MVETNKGLERNSDQPAATVVGPPLELHPQTPAGKAQAAKDLAKSDDKMVKANVLPPLPDFPRPESLNNVESIKTLDANQRLLSDTVTLASAPSGSKDLRQVTQYDQSGGITERETSWKDAHGKKHDVIDQNGVSTNTIKDGVSTEKLITRADGSWEHDTIIRGKETITKVGKDHSVSLTDKNLLAGKSHETVTHANGFTEDNVVDTRAGYKDLKTRDSTGLLRFEHIDAAQTADGRTDYHLNKRYDHLGGVMSDDSHWKDKDGVYHEDNLINFADRSSIHDVTTGDTTDETDTRPDGKSKTFKLKPDGTSVDSTTGLKRRPDALDQPDR
ncbi:MAG: hypothetical protein P4L53_15660 [Candidatus Obscuribacterales bacterium]|nr:hypothetical protein [Candidatus Obscuribacterales bacterium]